MRRVGHLELFLAFGALFPLLIWVGFGACVYQSLKLASAVRAAALTCAVDADCPPGYVCINGRCLPATG